MAVLSFPTSAISFLLLLQQAHNGGAFAPESPKAASSGQGGLNSRCRIPTSRRLSIRDSGAITSAARGTDMLVYDVHQSCLGTCRQLRCRTAANYLLYASSWGDEGEYISDVEDGAAVDGYEYANDSGSGEDGTSISTGRIRQILTRAVSHPVSKKAAASSAFALAILGRGNIQKISASALAVALALNLSKRIRHISSRDEQRETLDTDEEKNDSKGNESTKRWLKTTLDKIDRIDTESAEEKRLAYERQEAQRMERAREWAKNSLETTDDLKRRADKAREAEARAREWVDSTLQQDGERQKAVDRTRFGTSSHEGGETSSSDGSKDI